MAGGSTVDTTGVAADTASFDQAIFTSIRSPMGEGYRIVATSKGITADEKREIVQSAPSHDSLCDALEGATGLASFTLRGGRRCVFLSKTAGMEHTARGGFRVFTHVCVFDPQTYRRLNSDPFEIADALEGSFDEGQMKRPPMRLESGLIELNDAAGAESDEKQRRIPAARNIEQALRLAAAVLAERRMLVLGAPHAREIMSTIIAALPAFARRRWSFSYGLKYSPGRRFDLMLTEASRTELARIQRDNDVALYQWADPPAAPDSPYGDWLRFVARRWKTGRGEAVREICAAVSEECEPAFLTRLATLREDLERAGGADRAMLNDIERRHNGESGRLDLHVSMLSDLHKAVAERRRQLDVEEQARADAEETVAEAG